MQKIIFIVFILISQSFANEKSNHLENYNSWDAVFVKELEDKKFNTYIQLVRSDFERLNIDKRKFNDYVLKLNDAMGCYSKSLRTTYNNPNDFRLRYYSKEPTLLNEMFLMGKLCIKRNVNGYEPNTGWTSKDKQEFSAPIEEEVSKQLSNDYSVNDTKMLNPLSNKITDCFINKIEKDYPNHITLIEHYFNGMNGKIEDDIVKYISNTKNQCIDLVLDKYENSFDNYKELSEKIRIIASKYMYYPPSAIRLKQQGIVEVQFILSKSGYVSNISINKSSEFDLLDMTAIDIVKNASKDFPKPSKTVRMKVPIVFKIK